MNAPDWTLERLGDAALLLRFGDVVDLTLNAHVHDAASRLGRQRPRWLVDIVPAYATLGLFVDVATLEEETRLDDPLQFAETWVHECLAHGGMIGHIGNNRIVEIPVFYGGDNGPDLADLATHANLTPDEVVRRHTAPEYMVAMLGFAPGFPYLIGLDPALAMPRLASPRQHVPAGSVAIGGAQTGLYPQAGPGGWRLIGRTNAVLFDPARDPATALQPGDRLRFVARPRP